MIDLSISNIAAAANRQDTRSLQVQREANTTQVEEQASSQPMAASGVEAAHNLEVSISSQPAGVVTRLGETTEQQPLYSSSRPTGTIIRPSIELAQNTLNARPATENVSTETPAPAANANERAAEATNVNEAPQTAQEAFNPNPEDLQKLI